MNLDRSMRTPEDLRRLPEHSIIEQGDEVLLKQTREKKLDTNFQPMHKCVSAI